MILVIQLTSTKLKLTVSTKQLEEQQHSMQKFPKRSLLWLSILRIFDVLSGDSISTAWDSTMTGKLDHQTVYRAVRVTLFQGGVWEFPGSPNDVRTTYVHTSATLLQPWHVYDKVHFSRGHGFPYLVGHGFLVESTHDLDPCSSLCWKRSTKLASGILH